MSRVRELIAVCVTCDAELRAQIDAILDEVMGE